MSTQPVTFTNIQPLPKPNAPITFTNVQPIGAAANPPNTGGVSGSWDEQRPMTVSNAILHPFDTLQNGAAILQSNVDYRRHQNLVAASQGKPLPYSNAVAGGLNALADTEKMGASLGTPKNLALTAGMMIPGVDIPVGAYIAGSSGYDAIEHGRQPQESHADYLQRILGDAAGVAGGAAAVGEGIQGAAKFTAAQKARVAENQAALISTAKRVRDSGAAELRANINNAVKNAETHVGRLVEHINSADQADIAANGRSAGIDARKVDAARKAAEDVYRQAGQKMPAADAIAQRLQQFGGMNLTFEEAKQLRSDLYSAKAMKGNQSGIIAAGYNTLSDLMKQRATELGFPNAYEEYHNIMQVLRGEDFDKSLGPILDKLNSAQSGEDILELFRNSKYSSQIEKLEDSLSRFGLAPKLGENFLKDYGKVEEAIKRGPTNFMGILRSVIQHPVRSVPAYAAGHAAGGFVGGYIALGLMNDLAERAALAKELERLPQVPRKSLFKSYPQDKPIASIGEQMKSKGQEPLKPETFGGGGNGQSSPPVATAAEPKPVQSNGSGAGKNSAEDLSRREAMQAKQEKYVAVDTRTGAETPIPDNADAHDRANNPGPYERTYKINANGQREVVMEGAKARGFETRKGKFQEIKQKAAAFNKFQSAKKTVERAKEGLSPDEYKLATSYLAEIEQLLTGKSSPPTPK